MKGRQEEGKGCSPCHPNSLSRLSATRAPSGPDQNPRDVDAASRWRKNSETGSIPVAKVKSERLAASLARSPPPPARHLAAGQARVVHGRTMERNPHHPNTRGILQSRWPPPPTSLSSFFLLRA
jgi:hypothetical protein